MPLPLGDKGWENDPLGESVSPRTPATFSGITLASPNPLAMSYCLNPQCSHPQNGQPGDLFCVYCGTALRLGDRFRAQKPLRSDRQCRTFLGQDEAQHRAPCVIKQIFPHHLAPNTVESVHQQFQEEVNHLKILGTHPQIPRLLWAFTGEATSQGLPTLVQEFIGGFSLTEMVAIDGAFSEGQLRRFLENILPVFHFIHGQGVIHRDINPDNIIAHVSQNFMVVDFTAAKVTTKTQMGMKGTLVGSAAYAAPEQLRGTPTFSSDLYSLGVVCLFLLTMIHPFDLYDNLTGQWRWQDYLTAPLGPELTAVLSRMLAPGVFLRYQTAADIWRDLFAHPLPEFHPPEPQTPEEPGSPPETSPTPNIPPEIAPDRPLIPDPVLVSGPHWRLTQVLRGHKSSVTALAFHPDGRTLLSGGSDRKLCLWQWQDGAKVWQMPGHRSVISGVAFYGQGQGFLSSSWDYQLKWWETATGGERRRLSWHQGWIRALACGAHRDLFATAGSDRQLKLGQLSSGELLHHWPLDQDCEDLTFHPQGSLLAGAIADKIYLWNCHTKAQQQVFTGHKAPVTALAFSPGGQILFSASEDHTLRAWQLGKPQSLKIFRHHHQPVAAITLNGGGDLLVSGGRDREVGIWQTGSGQLQDHFRAHDAPLTAIALDPTGQAIATGGEDKLIKIWQFIH